MHPEREARLNEVLEALRKIPGLSFVQSDDFNDNYIDIFLTLQPKCGHGPFHLDCAGGSNVYEWEVPLRTVKAAIRRTLKECNVLFNWLDYPVMQYYSSGGEKFKNGYDKSDLKIDVLISEPSPPPKPRSLQMTFGERR